jgi:signal transduction histidine kinase
MSNSHDSAPEVTARAPQILSVRSFLWSWLDPATARAFFAVLIGPFVTLAAVIVLMTLWSIGGSLLVFLIGIPVIGFGIEASRYFARVERWRMELADKRPLTPHPYRSFDYSPHKPYGTWLREYGEGQFLDPSRWRDVVYTFVALPLAVIQYAVVIALWATVLALLVATVELLGTDPGDIPIFEPARSLPLSPVALGPSITGTAGLLLIPVAAFVTRVVIALQRAVVETLLCVSPSEALRQDVERLRTSRSAAVELEASELRRIERDLHDGAQQRLVMLAMDLGRAEEKIDSDPAAAKALVADAREQSRLALAELRDLVRGMSPSILIDRGLVAAVASIAGRSQIETVIDSRQVEGQRFSPAVERAGYFVTSEALTNVAKHSVATRSDVIFWRDATRLFVEIWDNGAGGATIDMGGGLAGLRDRVATLDGSLDVSSPPGGPTMVRVTLPIAAP